jgi:CheY-like chemotaxis protein
VKQCTVLFVRPDRQESAHPEALRGMGFLVDEVIEWPDDDLIVRNYHVVIVRVRKMNGAPMLAARLRAKPHFGRRLLIALVTADTLHADRRAAEASGFDDVMNDCCDSRHLTTRILRVLRTRPELRCVLPPLTAKRSAA